MKGKNKLVKSVELSSLDGVKEISFGKSSPEARMRNDDFCKYPKKESESREYDDVTERNKRYGIV